MNYNIEKEILKDINNYSEIEMKKKKQSDTISNIRLIIIITGVGFALFFWINNQSNVSSWALLFTLVVFGYFVKKHDKIHLQLERLGCLIEINRKNLYRIGDEWTNFNDDGKEFMNPNHPFVNDLDIFGPKSLFQWINTTNTFHGRQFLKAILETPETNIEEIKVRQKIVRELAGKSDFCQNIQCEGMLVKGGGLDPSPLVKYAQDSTGFINEKWIRISCLFVVGLTIMSIIATISNVNIPFYIPLLLVLVQILITLIGYIKIASILNTVHRFRTNIKAYEQIIKIIEGAEFKEPGLLQMKQVFALNDGSASSVMKKLDYIVEAIDLRYNSISYFILNFLLLWDYHCVFALEEWKKKYGIAIGRWFYTIGYFEALASLAIIAQLNPQWNFPSFTKDGLVFLAKEIGHPLISHERRVCNNIHISNEICVITGSNMSGKTTMLRTIGINLVLAYSGAPVCANSLECSVMDIFTSMRINDDLSSGISTFYAELLRIKMIIAHLDKKQQMIFLIDEIFRGTNSNDRITGAVSVLQNLSKPWAIGLISTHDLELCNLADDYHSRITNYHFIENYLDGKINFDFKIRPGRCNSTNAKYLMKMVGIEVLE